MDAVVNFAAGSASRQSGLLFRPSCSVPAFSSSCCARLSLLPSLRSKNEGLDCFCGGGISGLKQSVTRRVHLVDSRRNPGLECRALTDLAELAPVTAAVYGASLLGGGLFAYTRTGSKGSLGGGIVGGLALGVAFFLMQVPETQDLGQAVGFGNALLFAAVFGIRLAATGKAMPSGALLIVSSVATVIFANAYFQARLHGPPM